MEGVLADVSYCFGLELEIFNRISYGLESRLIVMVSRRPRQVDAVRQFLLSNLYAHRILGRQTIGMFFVQASDDAVQPTTERSKLVGFPLPCNHRLWFMEKAERRLGFGISLNRGVFEGFDSIWTV